MINNIDLEDKQKVPGVYFYNVKREYNNEGN